MIPIKSPKLNAWPRTWYVVMLRTFLVALPVSGLSRPSSASEVSFNQQVRPILAEYCLQCHGPDEEQRQGDLRLDIAEDGLATALVPHHPEQSEIIKRILTTDPELQMPPPKSEKQLTKAEIDLLRQWIAEELAMKAIGHLNRFAGLKCHPQLSLQRPT